MSGCPRLRVWCRHAWKVHEATVDLRLVLVTRGGRTVSWRQIECFFPGRKQQTLQVRYCTKLKERDVVWDPMLLQGYQHLIFLVTESSLWCPRLRVWCRHAWKAKTTDITGPLLYQIEGKGRGLGYCFGMFILPQKAFNLVQ
jgi:hypothetical protein